MEEFFTGLPGWVKDLPDYFTGLVVLASVIVRFTPNKEDDKVVGKAISTLNGILHRFPTIGLNPRTKQMKKALEAFEGTDAKSSNSPS